MIDPLAAFIDGTYETDFKQRDILAEKLSKRIARIEKQSKKIVAQAKENLRRFF